jgi:glycosyltransferase involved in cell wall biosynthesis
VLRAVDLPDRQLKILVIAGMRFPIRQPFIGGLEAHTWALVQGLRARGHLVHIAAADGSDPDLAAGTYGGMPELAPGERQDTSETPALAAAERAAFAALLTDLREGMLGSFDVVHNNSLYPAPVEQASTLPHPLVSTLHTPALPWAPRVFGGDATGGRFIAVSAATAESWSPWVRATVVPNGVDTDRWPLGPGGAGAVWSGRFAPEKGAHLAVDLAAAAGLPITLAGPVLDRRYFDRQIAPRLGETVRYAGHLGQAELAALVGRSAVALVTPTWDEPFGLVAIEAGATGTPVVAFGRGGLPEIIDTDTGRLLPIPASSQGLSAEESERAAEVIREAMALDRSRVRAATHRRFGLTAMVRGYETVYQHAILEAEWV